ncbi:MAG: tetratricopeptide repeat protein [Sneathiella sp.]|uniref:tetratricopeptide repeat protein n=1 Tax=Sneathiella sp. TaxID=1964365 RepID=UPI003003463C
MNSKAIAKNGIVASLVTVLSLMPATFEAVGAPEKTEVVQKSFNVFDMPRMSTQLAFVLGALKAGKFELAEKALQKVITQYPDRAENHFLLATILASQNKKDPALDALTLAIDNGFQNSERLQQDPNLKSVRLTLRFKELAERVLKIKATETGKSDKKIEAYHVKANNALVSASNTTWNPRFGILLSRFDFDSRRVAPLTVQRETGDPIAKQLNEWFRRGFAAGNNGDLYDNRDHQHSALRISDFPQFGIVEYSPEAKDAGIDYGLNTKILFNAPTIGNSSTGINGLGSQASLAYILPFAAQRLYIQYAQNHLYVYPAVSDYSDKNGDVLSATTPYMIISLGKSGSDRPFLKALASILAAFDPNVKDGLVKRSLLMPTVQMILREGQIPLQSAEDYLTYKAHPPVFDGQNLDVIRMIVMAQEMKLEDVPPMVSLSMVDESKPRNGIDDSSRILPETLFKTPGAIARVVRSSAKNTTLEVSAEKTKIPPGQKLTYHWVVLRGDAKRIKINPKNADGSVVEITVPWHDRFSAPERPEFQTHRVEIGAFVNNGTYYSAPAFVSFLFPTNQRRSFTKDNKIASIDHRAVEGKKPYVDPQVFADRDWRDDYSYDEQGSLIGWRRTRGSVINDYTSDGYKVITRDTLGRPLKVERIKYVGKQNNPRQRFIVETATGDFALYQYQNDTDRTGVLKKN